MMTEAELQKQCQDYLTAKGFEFFHIPRELGRKRNQVSGIPDLIIWGRSAITYYAEFKSPEKKYEQWDIKDSQKKWMAMANKNKIPYILTNDFEEFQVWIFKNIRSPCREQTF